MSLEQPRIIGILSDTHKIPANVIEHVVSGEFKSRGVDLIIHAGDIEPQHFSAELFGGLPVICALTEEDMQKGILDHYPTPPGWIFTKPSNQVEPTNRIITLGEGFNAFRIYVGHKRSEEILRGQESEMMRRMEQLRKNNDNVRLFFSGHTHHQLYIGNELVRLINPGAIEGGFDGYEFAIYYVENDETVFCRIAKSNSEEETFSIGIIADSHNISKKNPNFWKKLVAEMQQRGVTHLVHCGGISKYDIGLEILNAFKEVHFKLLPDQKAPESLPDNWRMVSATDPSFKVNGYRFLIQYDLSLTMLEKSEFDMYRMSMEFRREHGPINFILCGLTYNPTLIEQQAFAIINPGNVINGQHFVVLCLPRKEITFSRVPFDPLPPFKKIVD